MNISKLTKYFLPKIIVLLLIIGIMILLKLRKMEYIYG